MNVRTPISAALRWSRSAGLLLLVAGCGIVQGAADLPGDAVRAITPGSGEKKGPDPIVLQENLLRFCDAFQASIDVEIERVSREKPDVDPRILLQMRIVLVTATTSIASGANVPSNLLDLTAFVTLCRMSIEEYWQPKVFGDAGQLLLEAFRASEADVWKLCSVLLEPAQAEEFRRALSLWRQFHPHPESVLVVQASGLAAELAAANKEAASGSGGLLQMFRLDPFSGLDPAVREITKSRLLAERALFVAQRLPKLLRWHAQMLAIHSLEIPAIKQLVANASSVSASVERVTAVAEKLPERLSKEREELVKALEAQEKTLRPLLQDARQTLDAGARMSESLTATLKTADVVLKRVEDVKAGADPKAEPFRIQDYTKAAAQMEATARQLTELLANVDRTLASEPVSALAKQAAPVVERAETGGKELLDRALRNAALLVLLVLVAGIVYRVVASRLSAPRRP